MLPEISSPVTLLQVFDMPRSLRFYRDLLGFVVHQRSGPTDDCGWVWLRRGDAELMLNTAYEPASRPAAPDPPRADAHSDTVLYFGCRELDEAYRHLQSSGLRLDPPVTAPYGMRQLHFTDPDGFRLCLQWRSQ